MPGTDSAAHAALVGLAVLALFAAPVTGRALATVVTLVHELGHAAVGLVVGGRIRRISIALDASGETLTLLGGRAPRTRLAAFALAGYPAPSLVGLAAAASVTSEDHRLFLLLAAVLVATALVLWVRNAWGIVVFLATAAGLWAAATAGADAVTRTVAIALAWAFSLGGVRACWPLVHGPRPTASGIDDAERVAQLTKVVPRVVVVVGFVGASAAGLLATAALLLAPR
ncbi:MAG: M50 family metallopeptidase [Acidimicrobiales bacterium]|nr:M50 family metallopeptidase [Acidimicrobiales bacterium]